MWLFFYILRIVFVSVFVCALMIMQSTEPASSFHMDPRYNHMKMQASSSSSRILYDIPCKVCRDHSSGKHYGIFACDGCAGFFKRSIRRNRQYVCKAKSEGSCVVDKTHRNQCRACRLTKCIDAGMNKDAVQHERGPRNSTLRRQMALYFKDPCESRGDLIHSHSQTSMGSNPGVLNLALPKVPTSVPAPPHHLMAPPVFLHPGLPKIPMGFPFTTTIPPAISAESTCESAARLLFMNVKWAKNVPAFASLPMVDQLLLLEESWRELFVLGAAQFLMPLDLGQLLHACNALSRSSDKALPLLHEVKTFQDTLARFSQLHVDSHEFSCLRAIVLFKTSFDNVPGQMSSGSSNGGSPISNPDTKTLQDIGSVTVLQDNTQLTLNKYITTAHPGQPLRFGKLLLLLPALRNVSNNTIEELFFRRTIGNIPIERIICDMYKANDV